MVLLYIASVAALASKKMYRTASISRVSDEYLVNLSPASKGSPSPKVLVAADDDDFRIHVPIFDATKKESPPKLPGEKAVHLIPLVLTICALSLWLFSKPIMN